jgi:polysaccharide pyruvyl transferase WcaK-like protein
MAEMVMENILLLNVHSSMNLGDEALLQSALGQLRLNFPDSKIKLCMNESASYTGLEAVLPSIYSWVHPIGAQGETGWKYGRLIWLLPATLVQAGDILVDPICIETNA